ncbi:hypothetical protein [Rubritalea tangerina]
MKTTILPLLPPLFHASAGPQHQPVHKKRAALSGYPPNTLVQK